MNSKGLPENVTGLEMGVVKMKNNLFEQMFKKVEWTIRRFDEKGNLINESKFDGNILLEEGIDWLWSLVCSSATSPHFDSTNAHLGVGDSNTPENKTQTGLLGTNVLYKGMDSGYPQFGSQTKAVWKATFGPNEANWAWNEFTVANGNSNDAKNLNRKVSAQGTKIAGQTWELTLEITLQ